MEPMLNCATLSDVMPGLVPGIHVEPMRSAARASGIVAYRPHPTGARPDVDPRDKPGDDGVFWDTRECGRTR
jgi:hypothetical protein